MRGNQIVLAIVFLGATWAFGSVSLANNALADRFELVMSQDDVICRDAANFFTDYLETLQRQYPEFESVQWQPKLATKLMHEKHPRFSSVNEESIQQLSPDLQGKKGEITQFSVDIDNDGQLDRVVKVQWRLRGVHTDQLAIFRGKGKPEDQFLEFSMELLGQADGLLDFSGNGYELKNIPTFREGEYEGYRTTGAFELALFQFDGKSYISLTNPYPSKGKDWSKWRVVAQYREPSKLEDICYLKRVTPKSSKSAGARKAQ